MFPSSINISSDKIPLVNSFEVQKSKFKSKVYILALVLVSLAVATALILTLYFVLRGNNPPYPPSFGITPAFPVIPVVEPGAEVVGAQSLDPVPSPEATGATDYDQAIASTNLGSFFIYHESYGPAAETASRYLCYISQTGYSKQLVNMIKSYEAQRTYTADVEKSMCDKTVLTRTLWTWTIRLTLRENYYGRVEAWVDEAEAIKIVLDIFYPVSTQSPVGRYNMYFENKVVAIPYFKHRGYISADDGAAKNGSYVLKMFYQTDLVNQTNTAVDFSWAVVSEVQVQTDSTLHSSATIGSAEVWRVHLRSGVAATSDNTTRYWRLKWDSDNDVKVTNSTSSSYSSSGTFCLSRTTGTNTNVFHYNLFDRATGSRKTFPLSYDFTYSGTSYSATFNDETPNLPVPTTSISATSTATGSAITVAKKAGTLYKVSSYNKTLATDIGPSREFRIARQNSIQRVCYDYGFTGATTNRTEIYWLISYQSSAWKLVAMATATEKYYLVTAVTITINVGDTLSRFYFTDSTETITVATATVLTFKYRVAVPPSQPDMSLKCKTNCIKSGLTDVSGSCASLYYSDPVSVATYVPYSYSDMTLFNGTTAIDRPANSNTSCTGDNSITSGKLFLESDLTGVTTNLAADALSTWYEWTMMPSYTGNSIQITDGSSTVDLSASRRLIYTHTTAKDMDALTTFNNDFFVLEWWGPSISMFNWRTAANTLSGFHDDKYPSITLKAGTIINDTIANQYKVVPMTGYKTLTTQTVGACSAITTAATSLDTPTSDLLSVYTPTAVPSSNSGKYYTRGVCSHTQCQSI